MTPMELPLPTLLSQVLIAFTIEFDNEFEHQMPHRTTWGPAAKSGNGPWLVSLVMWANFMRFVPEEGIPVRELYALTGMTKESLEMIVTRMGKWWGYVIVEPDPSDNRPKPPPRDWIVRPMRDGRKAQELWRPLFGIIEERWRERFGSDTVSNLRESLTGLVRLSHAILPEYLPLLGYRLFTEAMYPEVPVSKADDVDMPSNLPLTALLSHVLLLFAVDFGREADLSLAMSANVLRLLDEQGIPVRALPRLSGVAKEAIDNAVAYLERHGYAVIGSAPTNTKMKLAQLTPKGLAAQDTYHRKLEIIEESWKERFVSDTMHNLRDALAPLVGDSSVQSSPLFRGLKPYPDGWRALVRQPGTLPHYPMILHRGGFPDGS